MNKSILPFALVLLVSCSTPTPVSQSEKFKKEIIAAEKAFCDAAKEKGVAEAFYLFADSNAVIKRRNDSLVHGREDIKLIYADPKYKGVTVTWAPDYVDVSDDGTLGWTYGHYEWITQDDSTGEDVKFTGVFHTVWKKQKDGSWKYVWD